MKTKVLSLVLLTALLLTFIVSCGGESGSTAPTETTAAGETTAAEEAAAETTAAPITYRDANLPEKDYGGYNFRIVSRWVNDYIWWYLGTEAQNGEVLNDAVYERNAAIEEAYNVKITEDRNTDAQNFYNKSISAGDDAFDVGFSALSTTFTMGISGQVIDLYSVPYIDLTRDWWDQKLKNDMTVKGHLFFESGDISPNQDIRTYGMVFNKDLCKKLALDYPYDMVRDGKWTLDTFSTYVKGVNQDINGDGVMDYEDRWGFFSETVTSCMFFISSKGRIAEVNKDGLIETNIQSEQNVQRLTKALELMTNQETTLWANPYVASHDNSWSAASAWYAEGNALIRSSVIEPIPRDYRTMETDFGVLPFPKYNEAQDEYYSLTSPGAQVIFIPMTVSDVERCGIILEALSAQSVSTVSPAFYDVCLNGKYIRDEESADMLDIIFDGKVYDVGYLLSIGSISSKVTALEKEYSTDVVSMLASIESAMQAKIDEYNQKFSELN